MANNNWVPKTRRTQGTVTNLRNFFEVVRLDLLKQQALIPGIACRRIAMTEKSDYTLVAWAQKAKLEARTIDTEPIDLKRLRQCIPAIRAMTTTSPEIFYPEMQAELANCGVALVTLPHLHGSFLHGATFIENNKIVMGLTLRGRDADKFWFSLFHELAHALQGHLNRPDGTTEADESEADKFAEEILIPRADWEAFVAKNDFSRSAIILHSKRPRKGPFCSNCFGCRMINKLRPRLLTKAVILLARVWPIS